MKTILFLCLLTFPVFSFSQIANKKFKVSLLSPINWYSPNRKISEGKFIQLKFSKEKLKKEVPDKKTTLHFRKYYKDTSQIPFGPCITYFIRRAADTSFVNFLEFVKNEKEEGVGKSPEKYFEDSIKPLFKNNNRAAYGSYRYAVSTPFGLQKIRVKIYFVLVEDLCIGITMTDDLQNDCSELFENVIEDFSVK